jgi:predicted nucleic acid-binding protein
MNDKQTIDTNVLIYAFGQQDDNRKKIAIDIISKCNIISLQVVNETIYVLHKKFKFGYNDLEKVVTFIKQNLVVSDMNLMTLNLTIKIATQYSFSFWDSMIVASALNNHCTILYSEDLHHNQIIDGKLKVINPFKSFE